MTKTSVDQPISLGQRAAIADDAHAALAMSIHDQAGANGGIGFGPGNNIVYYQSVGDYRATASGPEGVLHRRRRGRGEQALRPVFATQRAPRRGHPVRLQGNTGYDLGSRGLAAGDIWMVQLLSACRGSTTRPAATAPARVGLDAADERPTRTGWSPASSTASPRRTDRRAYRSTDLGAPGSIRMPSCRCCSSPWPRKDAELLPVVATTVPQAEWDRLGNRGLASIPPRRRLVILVHILEETDGERPRSWSGRRHRPGPDQLPRARHADAPLPPAQERGVDAAADRTRSCHVSAAVTEIVTPLAHSTANCPPGPCAEITMSVPGVIIDCHER